MLFLLHNILNYKWYAGLFEGKYNFYRIIHTTVNFLLLAFMTGIAVSGTTLRLIAIAAAAYAVNKGVLPILGVTKIYQVEEAVKIADIVLTAEEIAALEAAADKSGVDSIQFWESKME